MITESTYGQQPEAWERQWHAGVTGGDGYGVGGNANSYLVVDPVTGGAKGNKLARFDLMPARQLWKLAEHYGKGAAKYELRNWERGYAWSLSFAALMRHAWAFWAGEDNDPESGMPHMAAVAFHALALMEFAETHPDKDDRVKHGTR